MAGPPRRLPYPYDMVISGQGVMLGRKDAHGQMPLIGAKVQPFDQAAPDDYTYDTQPPMFERVQPYNDLTLGFGLRKQGSYQDRKYYYAKGVDCSIAGMFCKGPAITTFTPGTSDSTHGIQQFFELNSTLFALNGTYILKYISDTTWSVAATLAAPALNVATFSTSTGSTNTTYAWIAVDGALPYYFDGTTATQVSTGSWINYLAFCQVGTEFWGAQNINQLNKVDTSADPTNFNNWTNIASFTVGDKTSPIVSLVTTSTGSMLIMKTDGVYTVDDAGQDHKLFGSVASGTRDDTDNGKFYGQFSNDLHFSYAKQHFRAVPTVSFGHPHLVLEEIGPEKFTENDSPVRGGITAFLGHGGMGAYAGLFNYDTGQSYLLKFSSWLTPVISQGQLDQGKRIDAWHGAIDTGQFAGKKITALWRTSSIGGAPSGHLRLVGGCSDGTLFWFTLPCVPNPTACSSYTFTTTDGELHFPYWHGTFEADAKALRSVSVLGTNLSPTNHLRFFYSTDPTQAWQDLGADFVGIRQRSDFPNNTGVYLAGFYALFRSTSPSSSPLVTAIAVHHAVRPALILTYSFSVLAANGLVKRNGAPFKSVGAVQIRDVIRNAAAALGAVTVYLPDDPGVIVGTNPDGTNKRSNSQQLTVVNYTEGLAWDERLRRWQASLDVDAVQYVTNTQYGTWQRAQAYTWNAGLSYSWLQLLGI